MNIVIDLRPLLSGQYSGVENYTIEVTKALIANHPEHHFICWLNNFKNSRINLTQFQFINSEIIQTHLPNKILNILLSLFNYPKINQLLHRQIDLIYMPDLRPISSSKKYRIFATIHDLSFLRFPNFFSLKSRLWYFLLSLNTLIKKFNHIFTVSNFSKQEIMHFSHLPESKITIATPAIPSSFIIKNFSEIQKRYHLPEKYLLSLSTIEPRKNIKNTLLAFSRFQKNHPEYHLVVAGQQNPRLFAKNNLSIPAHCHFPGFIQEEDKYSLYFYSQGLIYLSLYEGFGIPIIEAAQANLPILTSNQTSTKEIAPPQALLANPTSLEDIVKKMENLIKIPKPVNYDASYLEKFSWIKTAENIAKKLIKS